MHNKSFIYVDGYLMVILAVEVTPEELKSLFSTSKKKVVSISNHEVENNSIQWNVTTVPKVAPEARKSLIGLATLWSKTEKVLWKNKSRQRSKK